MRRILRHWPLAVLLGLVSAALAPALDAPFGAIDDHDLARMLGRDTSLPAARVLPVALESAAEPWGRFRPGYHFARAAELYLAGGDGPRWHLDRLLLALFAACALYRAALAALDPVPAAVTALTFFAGPQNETWYRLGPNEAYGLPLVLAGSAWVAAELGRGRWRPLQHAPGLALIWLSGFVKESFVPCAMGALVFVQGVLPLASRTAPPAHARLRPADRAVVALLTAGTLLQAGLVLRSLLHYGHVYHSPGGLGAIAERLGLMFGVYALTGLPLAVLALGLRMLPAGRSGLGGLSWRREGLAFLAVVAGAVVLVAAPQALVYRGAPAAPRYLSPGNLAAVLATAAAFYYLAAPPARRAARGLYFVTVAAVFATACAQLGPTRTAADAERVRCEHFQESLRAVRAARARHPGLPLVFCSAEVYDFEPLYSVAEFLAPELPDGERFFLRYTATPPDGPLEADLHATLTRAAREGEGPFERADRLPANGRCIAVLFSGAAVGCGCAEVVPMVWY